MIFIVILSVTLIWLHVSSLRFIIRTNTDITVIEEAEKLEKNIPEDGQGFSLKSGPGLISFALVVFLNLIEICYFIACVYIFSGLIVILGSSILAGYTLYSAIKFIPSMKTFYSKPSEYLKEKTTGLDNILSFVMTSLEVVFCIYILVRAIMDSGLLNML